MSSGNEMDSMDLEERSGQGYTSSYTTNLSTTLLTSAESLNQVQESFQGFSSVTDAHLDYYQWPEISNNNNNIPQTPLIIISDNGQYNGPWAMARNPAFADWTSPQGRFHTDEVVPFAEPYSPPDSSQQLPPGNCYNLSIRGPVWSQSPPWSPFNLSENQTFDQSSTNNPYLEQNGRINPGRCSHSPSSRGPQPAIFEKPSSLTSPFSPTPSVLSVTSSNIPEVLLCLKDGCPKTFTGTHRRGSRARHMRLKHPRTDYEEENEKEYPCCMAGCKKTYKRQDARLKHYRKKHPDLRIPEAKHRPWGKIR